MLSILLPAARKATAETAQSVWGDLRVALASIAAYAPEFDVVVGWSGLEEPRDLPPNPRMRLLPQAPGITTGSEAWNWCSQQTDAEELLILGDDCVLHPDSMRLILEDVATIREVEPYGLLGFVGARSNYVKGLQNVRSPNGSTGFGLGFPSERKILKVPMIVPVAAWIEHATFDRIGMFPKTNWFSDDLICWDLVRRGYSHFVSRAYVHHVGERGTGQERSSQKLLEQGLAWLEANRPDFLRELVESAEAGRPAPT